MPVQDHPAEHLSSFVPTEYKQQLLKAPPRQQLEDPIYQKRLSELRDNYRFAFIVQWFNLLRSEIKLTNDAFDVEALEEELLGLTAPIFLNRFKVGIIHLLTGYKINDIEKGEFDDEVKVLLPDYFESKSEEEVDQFKMNALPLNEQLDVIYELLNLTTFYDAFRTTVDRYGKPWEELRPVALYEDNKKSVREEYLILEDDRLYYRKLEYPRVSIPKKEGDEIPDFTPKVAEWKCLTVGIYQFDAYLQDLKKKAGKRTSSREYKLLQELKLYVERVFTSDFKRRKQAIQRRKELQLQALLANRKRSSRLEEKEKRRAEEEEARLAERERLKKEAASIRASKRMKLKEGMYRETSVDTSLTREERLALRRSQAEQPAPVAPKEEEWVFDCVCGVQGKNYDDGTAMISCEGCNKWQHYACQPQDVKLKLDREEGFQFRCRDCSKPEEAVEVTATPTEASTEIVVAPVEILVPSEAPVSETPAVPAVPAPEPTPAEPVESTQTTESTELTEPSVNP